MRRITLSSVACLALSLSIIFRIISLTTRLSEKKTETKLVFGVVLQSFFETFFIEEELTKYYYKRALVFIQSTHYSCQILMKLEFSRNIFEKYSNIKKNV